MILPSVVIAGTPRSGSTALHYYLARHDDVFMSTPKEVRFFNHNFDRGLDWYADHFVDSAGFVVRGESTPFYLFDREAMDRLVQLLPDVKLLITLRDPIERAFSHHWMLLQRNLESRDFKTAVEDEIPSFGTYQAPVRNKDQYLNSSCYAMHLEYLYSIIDPERVKVVFFDDLTNSPLPTMNSIAKFVGLSPFDRYEEIGRVVNQNLDIRSAFVRRVSKRLPGKLRALVARVNSKPSEYSRNLDPKLKARLSELFLPHDEKLMDLLGLQELPWSQIQARKAAG